jgi:hypothetical protein
MARDQPNGGPGKVEPLRQKANQFVVSLTIHRRRREPHPDLITMQSYDLVTRGPGLNFYP